MTAANIDLEGALIIEQSSYWEMIIRYPGNATGAFIKGQMKTDFGGDPIINFQSRIPEFDAAENKTSFLIFLNAGQTAKIPVPPLNKFWRYDLLLYLPSKDPFRLVQGKVFVSPGITSL